MTKPLLTVAQVSELVQLDETTIRRAIKRGELQASKPAGQIRIAPDDVDQWLEATRVEPQTIAPAPRITAPSAPRAPRPAHPAAGSVRARLRADRKRAA